MALFIGIFIALVVINALLLIFSSSLRYTAASRKEGRERIKAPKSTIYPLKVRESEYQEAV